jgi:hypothetical protein
LASDKSECSDDAEKQVPHEGLTDDPAHLDHAVSQAMLSLSRSSPLLWAIAAA